ncbi:hypothetical protein DKM19_38685 [Streptosporangium sp. 'caverna']|nr:hypothetical protein DKM19_38685 [Streptosporangium sp. 'caverna']
MLGLGKIFPVWAATMAKIELAGKLAIPAGGATAIWALAQPWDDDAVTKAWGDWRVANLKITEFRTRELDKKIAAITAAWPEGADRRAFDRFMEIVSHEVQQFETATGQMAGAVQSAQTSVHRVINTCGIFVDSLLAIIIASELMQLFGHRMQAMGTETMTRANLMPLTPATAVARAALMSSGIQMAARGAAIKTKATATKNSSALFLMGGTASAVVGVSAALLFNMGDLTSLATMDNQFPQPQLNLGSDGRGSSAGDTDFDDIRRRSVKESGDEGWTYT